MKKIVLFLLMSALSVAMVYPLLWLIGASFKTNDEIFSSPFFIPNNLNFESYRKAWETATPHSMGHYFANTMMIVIPRTFLAVMSSVLVSFGFARFDFPFKKALYFMLIGGMILPPMVTTLPMFMLWRKIGVLDTYIPLTLPYLFAFEGMFVFILIRFFKKIPKEFDEAARIDGCNSLEMLIFVLLPCIKPAVVSIVVFSFLWTMNEFFEPLIFIQSVEKYPVSLLLRLSVDSTGQNYEQNKIIALSVIGLIPSILIFSLAQRKFIGEITSGGLVE